MWWVTTQETRKNLSTLKMGTTCYINKTGNKKFLSVLDDKVLSGEYVGINSGFGTYIDKTGNSTQLPIDHPDVLSGKYVGFTKGYSSYRNLNTGERKQLEKYGPTNHFR